MASNHHHQLAISSDPKSRIIYSDRYSDDLYEYRHVILPSEIAKWVITNQNHLLSETEWRNLGVQQSPGWVNYMIHKPEPHILLFRRLKSHPLPSDFGRHDLQARDQQIQQLNFQQDIVIDSN